ncbi:MAG: hypothetical protein LBB83_09030 [Treponema sp.]|nr:hypothetical protein [Treponema sp.]
MRPKKVRSPFTLYLKETRIGPVWYARFRDEGSRRYAVTRSTGILSGGTKQRRYEAEQAARTMLPGIRFTAETPDRTDKPFTRYVADFWLPDSPYVRDCALVKKKPLAAAYISLHHEDVRRHIEPFPGFRGVTLKTLTAGHIRGWTRWMAERGIRGGRINELPRPEV